MSKPKKDWSLKKIIKKAADVNLNTALALSKSLNDQKKINVRRAKELESIPFNLMLEPEKVKEIIDCRLNEYVLKPLYFKEFSLRQHKISKNWDKASLYCDINPGDLSYSDINISEKMDFYVDALMPPISPSKIRVGDKVFNMSMIPGREKSFLFPREVNKIDSIDKNCEISLKIETESLIFPREVNKIDFIDQDYEVSLNNETKSIIVDKNSDNLQSKENMEIDFIDHRNCEISQKYESEKNIIYQNIDFIMKSEEENHKIIIKDDDNSISEIFKENIDFSCDDRFMKMFNNFKYSDLFILLKSDNVLYLHKFVLAAWQCDDEAIKEDQYFLPQIDDEIVINTFKYLYSNGKYRIDNIIDNDDCVTLCSKFGIDHSKLKKASISSSPKNTNKQIIQIFTQNTEISPIKKSTQNPFVDNIYSKSKVYHSTPMVENNRLLIDNKPFCPEKSIFSPKNFNDNPNKQIIQTYTQNTNMEISPIKASIQNPNADNIDKKSEVFHYHSTPMIENNRLIVDNKPFCPEISLSSSPKNFTDKSSKQITQNTHINTEISPIKRSEVYHYYTSSMIVDNNAFCPETSEANCSDVDLFASFSQNINSSIDSSKISIDSSSKTSTYKSSKSQSNNVSFPPSVSNSFDTHQRNNPLKEQIIDIYTSFSSEETDVNIENEIPVENDIDFQKTNESFIKDHTLECPTSLIITPTKISYYKDKQSFTKLDISYSLDSPLPLSKRLKINTQSETKVEEKIVIDLLSDEENKSFTLKNYDDTHKLIKRKSIPDSKEEKEEEEPKIKKPKTRDTNLLSPLQLSERLKIINTKKEILNEDKIKKKPVKKKLSLTKSLSDNNTNNTTKRMSVKNDKKKKMELEFKTPPKQKMEFNPFTPMPDFVNIPSPELPNKRLKYGLKKEFPKKKSILVLKECFRLTHRVDNGFETDTSSSTDESSSNTIVGDLSSVNNDSDTNNTSNIYECLYNFLKVNYFLEILTYKALDTTKIIGELKSMDIKINSKILFDYLDSQCISYFTNNNNNNANNKGKFNRPKKTSKFVI